MGERTGIAWTRSTFNPWIGCTEVSPGCDACYARVLDARHQWGGATHWGSGVPRRRTKAWADPLRWDEIARRERILGEFEDPKWSWHGRPGFWPVFPSLMDPFDNEVPEEWRVEFFELIKKTPNLTWLLLTKRIGNALKMFSDYAVATGRLPSPNIWIGASVVKQSEAERDLPKLRSFPAFRRFISYEPALEEVDWTGDAALDGISQIIVGGESRQGGHAARPFVIGWARSALRAARRHGTAFFMKQFGSNVTNREGVPHKFKDRAGSDVDEWPEDLRVQEWPT